MTRQSPVATSVAMTSEVETKDDLELALPLGRFGTVPILRHRVVRRFIKFAIVGVSGVPVTLIANFVLHELLGLPLVVSTALAVEVAIVTNFLGNNIWTFRGAAARQRTIPFAEQHPILGAAITWALRPTVRRFIKFNAVSLVGLLITTAVTSYLAINYDVALRAYAGNQYYLIANVAGIALAMVWNFCANVIWTWA
jgi:dolichol-phosphate mannosyltransferase